MHLIHCQFSELITMVNNVQCFIKALACRFLGKMMSGIAFAKV